MVRLALVLLVAGALPAQTLRIAVTAFDEKSGQAITGLSARNFSVRDGASRLTVESAEPQTGPLDLLLVVDTSLVGEVVRPLLPPLFAALREGEQLGLIGYAQSATLLQDFTSSEERLLDAAAEIRYGNNPRVLDALFAALDAGFEAATLRRAILVLSAGVEGRSKTGVSDVVPLARNRRAPIHFVYESRADSGLFEKVARSTAGSWFRIRKLKLQPNELAEQVFETIRSTYHLEVSGVRRLSDALEVEIVDAPAPYKKPVATVLSFE